MNNLNSFIVEGNVVGSVEDAKDWYNEPVKAFKIKSMRYFKNEAGRQEETFEFTVQVRSRLGETCQEYLKDGLCVRVVGRMENRPSVGRVILQADHVEFRPNK